MSGFFGGHYSQQPYVEAPAPPPMAGPSGYYDHMPPPSDVEYAEPGSPLVFPVSPVPSRDSSRNRRSTIAEPFIHVPGDRGRERAYYGAERLAVGGSGVPRRSNSDRSRTRPVYEVAKTTTRGRRSPTSQYYYASNRSAYSNSSYGGSRDHSRSHSRVRRHSRSPSCDSCDSRDDRRIGFPRDYEEDLSEQLRKVQLQLQQVHNENDKKRKEDEAQRLEKLRNAEIERKVKEQLEAQRKKESEKAAAEKRRAEDETRRIKEEARKLLEEERAKSLAEERRVKEEKERVDRLVQQRLEQGRQQQQQQQQQRRTYTKFSKVHLCKEALDERQITYTEEPEHFLVHRAVDKTEQNYLWARTKEIRNYYRQIQEAADKAPTVQGPNGGYVKYVQIAGQPYPIALPVTITQTPGGGQTSRVDPIKIKWTDIFRTKY